MRRIDANELVSKINKLEIFYFTGETDVAVHDCQMVELGAVLAEIDDAPTMDAVEVVHGKMRRVFFSYQNNHYECTCCNATFLTNSAPYWNYCPNCGAKMDGDGNE